MTWQKGPTLMTSRQHASLSSRVTTLEGQVQANTTDLSGLATRVRTLELKYDTNVTGNSWSVAFTSLSGVVVTGVWNESQGRIEF